MARLGGETLNRPSGRDCGPAIVRRPIGAMSVANWREIKEMARLGGETLNRPSGRDCGPAIVCRPVGAMSVANWREIEEMARRGGVEPPTPRFVVWCSIQLSYRRL